MKITGKIGWMLAVLLMSSCSNESTEERTPEEGGQAVCFVPQTEAEPGTRAIPLTQDNLQNFAVYAYLTEQEAWSAATVTPTPWMDHVQVGRQGKEWASIFTYYWPAESYRKLSFFAYAPYADGYNGITARPATFNGTTLSNPEVDFEILPDITSQTDFLIAAPRYDLTNRVGTSPVRLQFVHTTTKISFSAFCKAVGVGVLSIALTRMPDKGSMVIDGKNTWTINSISSQNFEYYVNGIIISDKAESPTDLSGNAGHFLMFPANYAAPSLSEDDLPRIVVTYTLKGVEYTKTVPVKENWPMGKSVRYLLDLGAEPTEGLIVKEVIIEDWKFDSTVNQGIESKGEIHTLAFDSNGSDVSLTTAFHPQQHEHGTMPCLPTTKPARTGYTFEGWSTGSSSGTVYQPGERIKINENITLSARWAAIP